MSLKDLYTSQIAPLVCVYFPKYVRLVNHRLGWILILLRISMLAFVVVLAIREKPWYESHIPRGVMRYWVEPANNQSMEAAHASDMESELCSTATRWKYDYQFDEEGQWTYFNHTCKKPSYSDSFIKGETELFIPTFVSDGWTKREVIAKNITCEDSCSALPPCFGGSGFQAVLDTPEAKSNDDECLCQCDHTANYYNTAVEELLIYIDHAATLKHPETHKIESLRGSSDLNNMRTIVKHFKDGRVLKEVPAGETLSFSVRELLEFSDVNLMNAADFTTSNHLNMPGTYAKPLLKLTGLELIVKFDFVNAKARHIRDHGHDGPVCIVEVSAEKAWSSSPVTIEYGSADDIRRGITTTRLKYMYGLKVKLPSTGTFAYVEVLGIFVFLGSAVAFFSLPMVFMHVLIWFFLGDLTDTMDDVLHETPSWTGRFADLVSKVLVAMFVFDQIKERGSSIDAEFSRLASYSQDSHGFEAREIAAMRQIVRSTLRGVGNVDLSDSPVSEEEFVMAFANGESLQRMWRMFDPDRKRPFLQKCLDDNLPKRMSFVQSAQGIVGLRREHPKGHLCLALPETRLHSGADQRVNADSVDQRLSQLEADVQQLQGWKDGASVARAVPGNVDVGAEVKELATLVKDILQRMKTLEQHQVTVLRPQGDVVEECHAVTKHQAPLVQSEGERVVLKHDYMEFRIWCQQRFEDMEADFAKLVTDLRSECLANCHQIEVFSAGIIEQLQNSSKYGNKGAHPHTGHESPHGDAARSNPTGADFEPLYALHDLKLRVEEGEVSFRDV